ncbi:hypothetical protein D3C78_1425190 [compost metagenome]
MLNFDKLLVVGFSIVRVVAHFKTCLDKSIQLVGNIHHFAYIIVGFAVNDKLMHILMEKCRQLMDHVLGRFLLILLESTLNILVVMLEIADDISRESLRQIMQNGLRQQLVEINVPLSEALDFKQAIKQGE